MTRSRVSVRSFCWPWDYLTFYKIETTRIPEWGEKEK